MILITTQMNKGPLLMRLITCCLLLLVPMLATAKIVFISQRDGGDNIYVMDDNGSDVQRLTFTQRPHWDTGPYWSPDGTRIAFRRNVSNDPRSQDVDLFIIDSDGSNEQNLTKDLPSAGNLTWAPDGQHIAFSMRIDGKKNIYVMDILTREVQRLTRNANPRESAAGPSWSPDGKYIAYRQAIAPLLTTTIYVIRADGKEPDPLAPSDEWQRYTPKWSPDSKSILYFEALYDREAQAAFTLISNRVVIQKHGADDRQILNTPQKKWLIHTVCWMDNGKKVLIAAEERDVHNRQIEIYQYHLATGKVTNLTNDPEDDYGMHWISDDVLSVTPKGKMQTQWGAIKKFLQSRSETFKSLSQNVLFFLQNQR